MKIGCHCGAVIRDQTDNIPYKSHLTPDQGWTAMWDALESLFAVVATGRLTPEAASTRACQIFREAGSRLMWQCESCGRLYIDGRGGDLQCFVPSTSKTDKELLRIVKAD